MIFLDVCFEQWAEEKGLEVIEGDCCCGKRHKTTIPFITKNMIGLTSLNCKCGMPHPVTTYIKRKISKNLITKNNPVKRL